MLLAGGLTAYPFHVSPVIYLFFICFVNVFVVSDKAGWKLPGHATTKLLYGGSLLIVLAVFCLVCSKVIAVKQWHEIRSAYGLTPDNRIRSYEKLLPTLGGDGKFLAEFGEVVLEESSNYAKAFQLLEDSKKHFISYRGYNNTALACEQLNKVEGAIENYHFLSQYIPSRFHPKYAMFSVYRKFNDSVQAKQMAATILAMPVKIPSAEVTRMKMDAAEFLNRKEEGQ